MYFTMGYRFVIINKGCEFMQFKEIAEYVGVSQYPEAFETAFETQNQMATNFCDLNEILKYEEAYSVAGVYAELAVQAAQELLQDEKLYLYGKTICAYAKHSTHEEIRCVPLPAFDGSTKRDLFSLLILYTFIPESVAFYKNRGFTDTDIKNAYKSISGCIAGEEKVTGSARLTPLYYNWTMLYVYGEVYQYDRFIYQFKKFTGGAILLKNRQTGDWLPMMTEHTFHKSGLVLGSAGAEDTDGAFEAEFEETETAFCGHPVYNGRVSPERIVCSKDLWECVLKPGDITLSVHIPKGTDITPAAVNRSFSGSFAIGRSLFPEHAPNFIVCYSWLLDPSLEDLLGENSRIVGFGKAFVRFPVMSQGTEYKHFVFRGHEGPAETLPEDTSLQRKIKQRLLSGGHVHYTAGIYRME